MPSKYGLLATSGGLLAGPQWRTGNQLLVNQYRTHMTSVIAEFYHQVVFKPESCSHFKKNKHRELGTCRIKTDMHIASV